LQKDAQIRYLYMHIIKTSDKNIFYVPRSEDTTVVLRVTDEQTNVTGTKETLTATKVGNFMRITPTFTFVEGRNYTLSIGNSGDSAEIYRGKAFCTNQTDLDKFTTNKDVYTEYDKTNANEYIVI